MLGGIRLVNDLGQIASDIQSMANGLYVQWTDPKEAPPTMRYIDIAFVPIVHRKSNKPMGVFVPDLCELAHIGGLKAQIEETDWMKSNPTATLAQKKQQPFYAQLYHPTGRRYSAFRLALLPVAYSDYDQKAILQIQKHVQTELKFRMNRGLTLLEPIYKYSVTPDYLRDLHILKMKAQGCRAIKVNLQNPADRTTLIERGIHYVAQRIAFFTTFAAAFTVAGLGLTSTAALAVVGTIMAKWCKDEFGTFDLAELLLREIGWLSTKKLREGEKISLKKSLKTTILVGALLAYCGIGAAAYGAYQLIMGYSLPALSIMGYTLPLQQAQMALAGVVAASSGLAEFAGALGAVRFFWGADIWYKQIDFSKEIPSDFEPVEPENLSKFIQKEQNKFLAKLDALNPTQSSENNAVRTEVLEEFEKLHALALRMQNRPLCLERDHQQHNTTSKKFEI